MFDHLIEVPEETNCRGLPTLRDVTAMIFRQRIWVLLTFVSVSLLFVLAGFDFPIYEAKTQLLVRQDRSDPMVSSQENAPPTVGRTDVTEEDLNSEVELIRSGDILRKVVLAEGLQHREHVGIFQSGNPEEIKIAKAVKHLAANLTVKALQKSDLVSIRYSADDPKTAERVLETLDQLYLEKSMQVHRPTGEYELFAGQTATYQNELLRAEDQLKAFTQTTGISAPLVQRDLTLKNMADAQETATQTDASVAETEQRIRALEQLRGTVSERRVAVLSTSDNPQLLQQMKSKLLELQLKHSEMLAKFSPQYKPVQDIEAEIVQTKQLIADESNAPVREQTTDSNPTHQWVEDELAKARADLAGLRAKKAASAAAAGKYQLSAQELQQQGIRQDDLTRSVKQQEDNYLTFMKKREEARINGVLDDGKIMNVTIAEPPLLPVFPARPLSISILFTLFVAVLVSGMVGFVIDISDASFRTPQEVSEYLDVPVLASIPKQAA
ncbi:MAG: Wzz/FepE/Etk N-terminal domain-containing protein [Terracidiphilus sp.]